MAGSTPIGADAHVDVPLSNLAVSAFSDGTGEFIADQLFPSINVAKQSDKYYTIEKDHFLMLPGDAALRAPKTKARRIEFTVSSDSYFCNNYALANEESLENLANADMAIRLRQNSVRLITSQLRRYQEDRIASIVTSIDNIGSGVSLSGTAKWSDYVNSDPIGDVRTAHAFIRSQTGLIANTMMIDWDTMQIIRQHPDLLDMYKYTSGGEVTDSQLAAVFKVDRVLVGRAIKNIAAEGQTATNTNVWGFNVLLAHTGPAVGLQTATLGMRFEWRPAGFPAAFSVERQTITGAGTRKVEVIETGHFQDARVIARNLGYLISQTL